MKTYYVSWSGGVDSTFVVTQLSQFPVKIQPLYFRGQTFRLSEPQELHAIETIHNLLKNDPRTKAELLPVNVIEKGDLRAKDREVILAHRRIYIRLLEEYKRKRGGELPPVGSQQIYADGGFISPQYIAIASFAKNIGASIAVGWMQDDLEHLPVNLSQLSTYTDDVTGIKYSCLDRCDNEPETDAYILLKDFNFPIIGQGLYKRDIWNWFETHGYVQIRKHVIFCQAPFANNDGTYEPCGMCAPCIGVIRSNVLEPFSKNGLLRYQDWKENHEKEPKRFRLKF